MTDEEIKQKLKKIADAIIEGAIDWRTVNDVESYVFNDEFKSISVEEVERFMDETKEGNFSVIYAIPNEAMLKEIRRIFPYTGEPKTERIVPET